MEDPKQLEQFEWVNMLQSELDKLKIYIPGHDIMAKFNKSLQAVVTSHLDIDYMDRHRFTFRETPPCTSWKAGCFCPKTPNLAEKGVNEIGQPGVDWAYHLAAVLRLMPTGKQRRAYLAAKHLIHVDGTHSFTVFFNGMASGMAACFTHLLGSLTPPVRLEAMPYQTGKGGKMNRQENASYHIKVESLNVNGRGPQESIIQLVLAFHQRLADWPGPYSHTKCYPWVIGNFCKTGMQHPPLILIELAMAAWEMTAEVSLLDIEPSSLACKMGAMSRPGPDMTPEALLKMRQEVGTPMLDSLMKDGQPGSWQDDVAEWRASATKQLKADRPGHWWQQTVPPKQPDAAAADGRDMSPKDAAALHTAVLGPFGEQVLEAKRSMAESDKKAREERAWTAEDEASAQELLRSVKKAAGPQVCVETLSIMVDVFFKQLPK